MTARREGWYPALGKIVNLPKVLTTTHRDGTEAFVDNVRTIRHCRNVECRAELYDHEAGPYCDDCDEDTEAFQPSQDREWHAVTAEYDRDEMGADQCASCGATGYTCVAH